MADQGHLKKNIFYLDFFIVAISPMCGYRHGIQHIKTGFSGERVKRHNLTFMDCPRAERVKCAVDYTIELLKN